MRPPVGPFYAKIYLLFVVIFLVFPFVALSECPRCSSDEIPMAGHGPAEDGSGRRTIFVKIDSTWGNPTNPSIWNQTQAACTAWNNATDQYGNKTGYYLDHG